MPEALNVLDLLLAAIMLLYALQGLREGVLIGAVELLGFGVALLVGLTAYLPVSRLLVEWTPMPYGPAKPIAFVGLWVVSDMLYEAIVRRNLPRGWWRRRPSGVERLLGLVPGSARGLLAVTVLLVAVGTIPFPEPITAQVRESRIAGELQPRAALLNREFSQIFGEAVQETIGLLTVKPDSNERVRLSFTVARGSVDPTAETRMLGLVNKERTDHGLRPLQADDSLREVARRHSQDMFARGYFGHVNPDNQTPFDRMRQGSIQYRAAGENLALAPTVEVAHNGLMNSEGHRRNILNPSFGRVGIGVVDGGLHGRMFTQNFAD